MNSIGRPRRRPRKHSVSFRTLWWLVAHEASFAVVAGPWPEAHTLRVRAAWAKRSSYHVTRIAVRVLRVRDWRPVQ